MEYKIQIRETGLKCYTNQVNLFNNSNIFINSKAYNYEQKPNKY